MFYRLWVEIRYNGPHLFLLLLCFLENGQEQGRRGHLPGVLGDASKGLHHVFITSAKVCKDRTCLPAFISAFLSPSRMRISCSPCACLNLWSELPAYLQRFWASRWWRTLTPDQLVLIASVLFGHERPTINTSHFLYSVKLESRTMLNIFLISVFVHVWLFNCSVKHLRQRSSVSFLLNQKKTHRWSYFFPSRLLIFQSLKRISGPVTFEIVAFAYFIVQL